MFFVRLWAKALCFGSLAFAQFPPQPTGLTVKKVPQYPGVSLSFKQTKICDTNVKAWSGFVHMPISYLSDIETADPYNVSMHFWYFEARNEPQHAPTAIYLAGGPGESSMFGAVSDGGPCYIGYDANSTYSNNYSWNNNVNMLYVDQPVGTGYSYDVLIKSTQDFLDLDLKYAGTGIVPIDDYKGHVPKENVTFKYGVFPSQNPLHTVNTTGAAAITLWHFTQVWFSEFPEWKTSDDRVSIWGNSYGGYWVPASAAYMQEQNVKVKHGEVNGTFIHLDSIGTTNGCIDALYQVEWYPQMAYNNTYDLQVIPKKAYEAALKAWSEPKGCRDLILECRALGSLYDPKQLGVNSTVNKLCTLAGLKCAEDVAGPYDVYSNRSDFDMAHYKPDPTPPGYAAGFFNRGWVQQEMGSPVNFTADSNLVTNNFIARTGDFVARAGMPNIEYLLAQGIRVTLVHGDRDYRCPWLGGEKLSLAANWSGAEVFRAAGYEYIHTNASYNGGVVRQHGNLTFARVFESGHDVSFYQPETSLRIFNRATFQTDIATGKHSTAGGGKENNYTTTGPTDAYVFKNKLPSPPPVACYLYDLTSCTETQYLALKNGTAVVDVGFNVIHPIGTGVAGAGFRDS